MKLSTAALALLLQGIVGGSAKEVVPIGSLRANVNQDARRTNRYWVAPIKNAGLTCIDNSIRAGGGKPNEICLTEGEALCVQYDNAPMGGRWQFGIKDSKLRLYDPKQEIVYEYCSDVSHVCIGEEHGFDPNRYSKERTYMTFYDEKTHKVVASLKCDGTDGEDDENIGQSTILKLVDNSDVGPYAEYPLTIVKFKKGQSEDPDDDNSLWNIAVGGYPTDQPTLEPTSEPTFSVPTPFPTAEPTHLPTYFPTFEPTFQPTGELPSLFSFVNFNSDKCEWVAYVDTFQELKRRIDAATDSDPDNRAKIEICNDRPIVFESVIDISNKYFEISCLGSECIFDLNGYSFVTRDDGNGSPFHAEFDGMTIKGGSSRKGRDTDIYDERYGGAFFLRGVSPDVSILTLNRCIARKNIATSDSGVVDGIDVALNAIDSIFTDNESGRDGGVAWIEGTARFEDCTFEGNIAADDGGALFFFSASSSITNCKMLDNAAEDNGGVIYLSSSSITLTNCHMTDNTAEDGGAIYSFLSDIDANDSSFVGNLANGRPFGNVGGAILSNRGTAIFADCLFDGNAADIGGAIYSIGSLTVSGQESSFKCNDASWFGGAIFHIRGDINTFDVDFIGNTAGGLGGGLYLGEDTTSIMNKCHFEQNSALDDPAYPSGVFPFQGFGGGAIVYAHNLLGSPEIHASTHTMNNAVFQNNTSVGSPSDDVFSYDSVFDVNTTNTANCGGGFGNCFCDADPSPLAEPNITTNNLPTTCSGAGVGLGCSGCTLPAPPVMCSASTRASTRASATASQQATISTRAGDLAMIDDVSDLLENQEKMDKKTGKQRQ